MEEIHLNVLKLFPFIWDQTFQSISESLTLKTLHLNPVIEFKVSPVQVAAVVHSNSIVSFYLPAATQ